MAVVLDVLPRHPESTWRRRVVGIVTSTSGVDIDDAVWSDDHVSGMIDLISKFARGTLGAA
jgi:hypothetical protein